MKLQKLELQTRAMLQLQEAGEHVSNRRLRQRKKELKIGRILRNYHHGIYESDGDFVRALAHLQLDFMEHDDEN